MNWPAPGRFTVPIERVAKRALVTLQSIGSMLAPCEDIGLPNYPDGARVNDGYPTSPRQGKSVDKCAE